MCKSAANKWCKHMIVWTNPKTISRIRWFLRNRKKCLRVRWKFSWMSPFNHCIEKYQKKKVHRLRKRDMFGLILTHLLLLVYYKFYNGSFHRFTLHLIGLRYITCCLKQTFERKSWKKKKRKEKQTNKQKKWYVYRLKCFKKYNIPRVTTLCKPFFHLDQFFLRRE